MIEFKDVSKVYPNGVVGLDNVNLKIEQGEFVAIIGLSGAGKSTLLRTINRMHDITSGTLTVDGLEVKNLKGKELRTFRRKIGMIFQSFNLVTRTTVIRNVLMAKVPEMPFWRVLLGVFKKEDKMQALESLDKVGILDKAYIRSENGQSYVYIADENNKLKKQYIRTGATVWGSVEIKQGLSTENQIAFPYGKAVKEGAAVKLASEYE